MALGSTETSKDLAAGASNVAGQLIQQAKRQPGKAAITGALVLVLLVLLVRLAVRPGEVAAAPAVAVTGPSSGAVNEPSPAEAISAAIVTRSAGAASAAMPAWTAMRSTVLPPRILTRDPFSMDLRQYAKVARIQKEEEAAASRPSPKARDVLIDSLKRRVATFHLDGTVTGPVSAAFLNGKCVHEGDAYQEFQVVAITEQSVVLESEGVRLELRMPER